MWAWPPPMFVTKYPGAIAFAVIPNAASSSARQCIRCRAPAFAAMYAEPTGGSTLVAASDVVTMILRTRGGAYGGRRTRRGEDAVEVDLDHAVPALVGVPLERTVLDPWPLATRQPPRKPTPESTPAFANATSSRPYASAASSIARSSAA